MVLHRPVETAGARIAYPRRDAVRTRFEEVGGDQASPALCLRHARLVIWRHPVTGEQLVVVLGQQAIRFEGFGCAACGSPLEATF